jgi:hypothetical protein
MSPHVPLFFFWQHLSVLSDKLAVVWFVGFVLLFFSLSLFFWSALLVSLSPSLETTSHVVGGHRPVVEL